LPDTIRVYLDTNIFIYAIERPLIINDEVADLLLDLIGIAPTSGSPKIVTSELFLAEALVAPFAADDLQLVAKYEAIQTREFNVDVKKIDLDILRIAARIRSTTNSIKLPDAIHLATAVNANCTHFLTADIALANRSKQIGFEFAVYEPNPTLLVEILKVLLANE
jgi:predicted nucleic acid-binding protein